jgi:hypothetical protein
MLNPECTEPNVQVFLPSYLPNKEEKCYRCKAVMAEPKTILRITKKKKYLFEQGWRTEKIEYLGKSLQF